MAVGVVVCASALRLIYGAQVELMPEETYYWNYSRHLDIGYLDHPPMVGWLIGCGTAVFGDTEFGVRDRRDGLRRHLLAVRVPADPQSFRRAECTGGLVLLQTLPFFSWPACS